MNVSLCPTQYTVKDFNRQGTQIFFFSWSYLAPNHSRVVINLKKPLATFSSEEILSPQKAFLFWTTKGTIDGIIHIVQYVMKGVMLLIW